MSRDRFATSSLQWTVGSGGMTSARDMIVLEPLALKLGGGWYVKATHPNGRIEDVTGFATEAEAKDWIDRMSPDWLRDRGYSDE
jgi:hypothetical protein